MQTKGYDLGELLGVELPPWTLLAATGLVGLLILRIALKPNTTALTTPNPQLRGNDGRLR